MEGVIKREEQGSERILQNRLIDGGHPGKTLRTYSTFTDRKLRSRVCHMKIAFVFVFSFLLSSFFFIDRCCVYVCISGILHWSIPKMIGRNVYQQNIYFVYHRLFNSLSSPSARNHNSHRYCMFLFWYLVQHKLFHVFAFWEKKTWMNIE